MMTVRSDPDIPQDLTIEHFDGGYLKLTLKYGDDKAAIAAYRRLSAAAKAGTIKFTLHVGQQIKEH